MKTSLPWCSLALALACGLAAATPVQAQKKAVGPYREGFWIAFGLGWGSAGLSCSGCSSTRYGSSAATLRMGGTLNRHLLLGGEINAWSRNKSGVTETVGDMSAVAYFYPSAGGTFFLKGGVGVAVYSANTSPKLEATGLGVNVGLGIDLYLGRKFSLTPYASIGTGLTGNMKVGGTDTGVAAKPNLFQVGVAASWH
jgi:hypothetical protein